MPPVAKPFDIDQSVPCLPRGLLTAEEISPHVYIEPERLRQMALAGQIPCFRVAGGDPLFQRTLLSQFLRVHYYQAQEAIPVPTPVRLCTVVQAAREPVQKKLPTGLLALEKSLCEYSRLYYPPCVYFLIAAGEVVYVGQTTNLPKRANEHAEGKNGTSAKNFDRVVYLPVPQQDLLTVELGFIKKLRPVYNNVRGQERRLVQEGCGPVGPGGGDGG